MKAQEPGGQRRKATRVIRYLRPYWRLELGIAFLMAIVASLSLVDPLAMKILIDEVIIDRNVGLLNVIAIALVALFLLRGALRVGINYLLQYVGQRILINVRLDLFQHLEHLHLGFFTKTRTGEIISRVNNDVAIVQDLLTTTLLAIVTDIVSLFVIFAIILYLNWQLTLMSMVIFPFLFITQFYMGRRIKKKSRQTRDKSAEIVSFFQEVFSSVKLVQSFARERFEALRLLRRSRELMDLGIMLATLGALAASVAGFLSALGPVIVLYYGGRQVMEGSLSLGSLVAFYAYMGSLFMPIFRLAQHNVSIQVARAAIDRIFEFFDIEPSIVDAPGSRELGKIRGEVEFENVSFAYDGDDMVLTGISFRVMPGQKVAIVGPSGEGKSTIVNLLERFYDPTSGRVLLDGLDLRTIRLSSLRSHIGLVSQETALFNATVRENIGYGKPAATESEIVEAARRADIHDFISSLPKGYETVVGERGLRLSGGQCQRLSIARTLLKDPGILILDEAMSSLDTKSEQLIHHALQPLMRKKTTIIVAHRLTSIVDADQIYVLHGGRFVEAGLHQDLLARGGIYRMLWDRMTREDGANTAEQ
jgi:subfamily B ATP-binding cassette protein MsbA